MARYTVKKSPFFESIKMQIKVQKNHTSYLLKVHSYPMNQMSNLHYNLIQISSRLTSRVLNKMRRLYIKTMLRCMLCLPKLKVVEWKRIQNSLALQDLIWFWSLIMQPYSEIIIGFKIKLICHQAPSL